MSRCFAAILLSAALASAQSSGTPDGGNGQYGPPVCAAAQAQPARRPAYEDKVAAAHREQQEGADDPRALPSAEPFENFDLERQRLADYGNCVGSHGCYWADLDTQYERAEAALAIVVKKHSAGEKLAIVFDIDETVLSKFCQMPAEDYGYMQPVDDAWTLRAEAIPIPGALRLFNEAKADGVAVFFITGRPGAPKEGAPHPRENQEAATERNLEAAGFHGWKGLALRNGPENGAKTIPYKSEERRKILEQGYHIVMSVGDQWSDLLGEPQADVNVKLPNPFYFIP
ncbi:MAG TPA: HAD family acid phosphatase [Acidobacteriaceae bacterium]